MDLKKALHYVRQHPILTKRRRQFNGTDHRLHLQLCEGNIIWHFRIQQRICEVLGRVRFPLEHWRQVVVRDFMQVIMDIAHKLKKKTLVRHGMVHATLRRDTLHGKKSKRPTWDLCCNQEVSPRCLWCSLATLASGTGSTGSVPGFVAAIARGCRETLTAGHAHTGTLSEISGLSCHVSHWSSRLVLASWLACLLTVPAAPSPTFLQRGLFLGVRHIPSHEIGKTTKVGEESLLSNYRALYKGNFPRL